MFWEIESRWWRGNFGTRYLTQLTLRNTHVCMPRLKGIDVPEVEMGNESEFLICCNRQPSTVNQSTRRQSRVNEDLH